MFFGYKIMANDDGDELILMVNFFNTTIHLGIVYKIEYNQDQFVTTL